MTEDGPEPQEAPEDELELSTMFDNINYMGRAVIG